MQVISNEFKPTRHTIVIDSEIESVIKELQAHIIETRGKSCSLSFTVNLLLLGGIIASEKLTHNDWSVLRSYQKHRKIHINQIPLENWFTNLSGF